MRFDSAALRQLNQLRDLLVIVSAGSAWPQFVVQTGEPTRLIAPAPVAHHRRTDPTVPRHCSIGLALARQQYNACAPHLRRRQAARAHHRLQLQTVGLLNRQGLVRSTHPRHLACHSGRRGSVVKLIMGHHTRYSQLGDEICAAMIRHFLSFRFRSSATQEERGIARINRLTSCRVQLQLQRFQTFREFLQRSV